MATTIHNFPSDGVNVARGTDSVANGGSVSTGLPEATGFHATSGTTDCVINKNSQSAGVVNVGVFVGGVASGAARPIDWIAWSAKKV